MDQHVARPRRMFVGLATMAVGAISLVGAFPNAANATGGPWGHGGGPGPGHGGGQPGTPEHPCPDEGWDFHWGPENQDEVPGTHTDGEFSVTISNVRTEENRRTFDFETSAPIKHLFAVGYPTRDEGVAHDYEPPVTEGTASTGDPEYIKHVYFCPAPETTTTTQASTTTTEASTTTTQASTTTTEAPTTTGPSTTEAPTTSVAPSTSVAPTTPPTSAISGTLPETGSNSTMPLVAAGVALVGVGVGLVFVTRRLRRTA